MLGAHREDRTEINGLKRSPVSVRNIWSVSSSLFTIYETGCGRSRYVFGRVRYARELQLRAVWHLRARRARGDARPGDDDVLQHGVERPRDDDAHALDASPTVPCELPPLLLKRRSRSAVSRMNPGSAGELERRRCLELILRHAEDGVVRIRIALAGCDCRPTCRRTGAGAGRRHGREHPLDLIIGYRH